MSKCQRKDGCTCATCAAWEGLTGTMSALIKEAGSDQDKYAFLLMGRHLGDDDDDQPPYTAALFHAWNCDGETIITFIASAMVSIDNQLNALSHDSGVDKTTITMKAMEIANAIRKGQKTGATNISTTVVRAEDEDADSVDDDGF